jgi:alpha-ketoglutarate-dependent taurine dioxygenase
VAVRAARGDLDVAAPACYPAYRRWATPPARSERTLTLPVRPGDCLVFDNARIRRGRTAFTGAGQRLLQGCDADLDGLAGSLAVGEGVAA